MIKAIIFDCFGVLTADLWVQFKEKHFSDRPELAQQATGLNKQADLGLIAYGTFLEEIAKLVELPVTEVNILPGRVGANELLFEYIRDHLKPRYKLAVLSNAAGNYLERLFSIQENALFDETILSFRVGIVKPQPEIYELAADKLGVGLSECVMVDDKEAYCSAARQVGMQAVCYRSFKQFKTELAPLLSQA